MLFSVQQVGELPGPSVGFVGGSWAGSASVPARQGVTAPVVSNLNVVQDVRVWPRVYQLNRYLQQAKNVAISSILPVLVEGEDGSSLPALRIRLEGPSVELCRLTQLLDDADLKVG
ncbi:MAG: hypothetical protein SFZ03_06365 [Candidatus Melainabacteria bacterium]|nr:hypothetical protein [Candidatus Melainabacteria bacterium]